MLCQVLHELVVDEGVEEFGDDGEEGDGAVVLGVGFVFLLVELDDLCDLQWVWVVVFVDGFVGGCGSDWCWLV